ncbi:unnamed protein product, partial [Plutella xylostella]
MVCASETNTHQQMPLSSSDSGASDSSRSRLPSSALWCSRSHASMAPSSPQSSPVPTTRCSAGPRRGL